MWALMHRQPAPALMLLAMVAPQPVPAEPTFSVADFVFTSNPAEPAPPIADYVFTSNRDGNSEIYLLAAGETEWRNLTDHPGSDNWPVWSPDGSRIAFQRMRDGKFDVWVMDADGSNPVRLTDHPDHDYIPAWSPDGSRILFVSWRQEPGDAERDAHLYVMNSDGTGQERFMDIPLGGSGAAVWAPDGSLLAIAMKAKQDNADIYLAANDGSDLRQLTTDARSEFTPDFSPDGTHLAFYAQDDAGSALDIVALEDGDRRLLQPHTWSWYPKWSPDGEWLTYTGSVRDDDWEDLDLYAVPVAGGDPVLVVGGPSREAEGSWRPTSGPDADKTGGSEVTEGGVLHKQIWVDAPVEAVWRAWTTEDGLSFVSAKSNVRLEVGGPYEWFLDLEPDERGRRGGQGAVVHAFLPPEMLAFSWTFPSSVPSLRSSDAQTRVVVRFSESKGGTHVDFHQAGWREGEDWNRGYQYFDAAWDSVLGRLKASLEQATGPPEDRPAPAFDRDRLAEEIADRERAFAASVKSRDLDAFRGFIHPEAVFIGGGSELRGAEEVVAAWSQYFEPDAVPLEWEPDRVAVDAQGRLAISTGPYWLQTAAEGAPARRIGGRFFSVWERAADGSWRVLFDAGTEAAPLD